LGSTRTAVDEGWAELDTMIGQSEKMINPELYVGVGLSGEQQQMVGIAGAKAMVVINNDRKSPVFEQVDYGVVDESGIYSGTNKNKCRDTIIKFNMTRNYLRVVQHIILGAVKLRYLQLA